jgi:ParB family transcriptional regulator, chromosome partitioning protein
MNEMNDEYDDEASGVAGLHRLKAARNPQWESIPTTIFDGMDADQAELAEIDENLIRADLLPIELIRFKARARR